MPFGKSGTDDPIRSLSDFSMPFGLPHCPRKAAEIPNLAIVQSFQLRSLEADLALCFLPSRADSITSAIWELDRERRQEQRWRVHHVSG